MKLQIEQIQKKYGEVQVLHDITIDFSEGKFYTLLGQSGCGKTTLLKIIAGLEEPTEGTIRFENEIYYCSNRNVNVKPNERKLGFVFQDYALWPHMSVYDNIAFGLHYIQNRQDKKRIVSEALKRVKLNGYENRKPSQLSGGQQQRVALARALVRNPKLILFDEPLSALDVMLREQLQEEIIEIIDGLDCKAIFVTHSQQEAMALSDQIVVMDRGRIVQIGTPEEIYDSPVNSYVAQLIGKINWIVREKEWIRPEDVRLHQREGDYAIEGIVRFSRYDGAYYQNKIQIGEELWLIYSSEVLPVGEKINVYVKEQHFKTMGEG